MNSVVRRVLTFGTLGVVALSSAVGGNAVAQEAEEGFPLPAFTAICPSGDYGGPFVGCVPWAGVVVTFANADDPNWTRTCETVAAERAATCMVTVPFGSTIIGSIMPSSIPDGYELRGDTAVEYQIPDGPPEGVFGGPTFVLRAVEEVPTEEPAPVETPIGDEPVVEDPVVDEPAPVETPIGDEPVTDPEPTSGGTVVKLPSTGAGTVDDTSGATASLLLGTAALLTAGAYGTRRATR